MVPHGSFELAAPVHVIFVVGADVRAEVELQHFVFSGIPQQLAEGGVDGEQAVVGDEGDAVEAGKPIASVESVKASAEIYASAGGTISAVNKDLSNKPETLNSDPYGEGWMVKVDGGATGDVMDSAAYEKYCEERAH